MASQGTGWKNPITKTVGTCEVVGTSKGGLSRMRNLLYKTAGMVLTYYQPQVRVQTDPPSSHLNLNQHTSPHSHKSPADQRRRANEYDTIPFNSSK